jgi:hypothetical protein
MTLLSEVRGGFVGAEFRTHLATARRPPGERADGGADRIRRHGPDDEGVA